MRHLLLPFQGSHLDGIHDLLVPGAAAEITSNGLSDLSPAWVGIVLQKSFSGQYHAGSAETTLHRSLIYKRLLQVIRTSILSTDALNRGDLPSIRLRSQDEAGIDQATIQQDRAGTAFAYPAAFLGTGQALKIAQQAQQAGTIRHLDTDSRPIQEEVDPHPAS
jgi:hypothetical protein